MDTMDIRLHRGSYSESIQTASIIPNTKVGILNYLKQKGLLGVDQISIKDIQVRFYADTPDREWSQDYIITCQTGVLGFCSKPVFR